MTRWQRWRCGVAALLLLGGASLAASAEAPRSVPWWTGLGDPVLNTLMQAAAPASPDAAQRLVQSYIAVRIGHLRLHLVSGLAQAAHTEQALWMSAPMDDPQRDAALAAVGQRLAAVDDTGNVLMAASTERLNALVALVADSGLSAAQLQTLLAPALAQPGLPDVVSRLPAAAAQARVPEPLAALAEEARRVSQGEQWVASRRVEWQAREQRQQLGGGDAIGTLQAYQQYVVDTDKLAQASGRLALNWALWLQRSSDAGR